MSKILFIALSDPHWHNWSNHFNGVNRLQIVYNTMAKIYQYAKDNDAAILLPGDLIHNPGHIDNAVLQAILNFNIAWHDVTTFAIDGNHDQSEQNTSTNRSPNYVTSISKVIPTIYNVADNSEYTTSCLIQGIPYLTGNKGFKDKLDDLKEEHKEHKDRKKILLIHTDLPRAKDSSGYQIDSVNNIPANIGKLFKAWDLVLCGHIHMGQVLHKRVVMVGAPYQQRRSDKNLQPGFWEIYKDMTYKFIPLDFAPTYKDGKAKDDYNFYTPKIKKKKTNTDTDELDFKKGTDTEDLVDRYMEAVEETDKKKKKLLKRYLM